MDESMRGTELWAKLLTVGKEKVSICRGEGFFPVRQRFSSGALKKFSQRCYFHPPIRDNSPGLKSTPGDICQSLTSKQPQWQKLPDGIAVLFCQRLFGYLVLDVQYVSFLEESDTIYSLEAGRKQEPK